MNDEKRAFYCGAFYGAIVIFAVMICAWVYDRPIPDYEKAWPDVAPEYVAYLEPCFEPFVSTNLPNERVDYGYLFDGADDVFTGGEPRPAEGPHPIIVDSNSIVYAE